ncbi:hypothetical protein BJ508DRAFT_49603 [Ascobolus immersus RN42]|uniref:Uncharacterized protein n=1 Tax=Ascobolus immersus RN42 TaxID=1160509 RepID=A0A3N4HN26_ASCIM|nr:hypothetical protein BJ508DRAFT_49603 [Ascobolus immersus RN42]
MSEMSIVTIEPSPIRGADQLAAPDHHRADNPPRPVVIVGRFRQELLDETKFYHGEESRGGRASGRVSNATVEESTAVEANIAEKGQADRGADDEAQISARRNLQSGATTDGDRKGKGVDRSEGGGDGMGQASSSGIKLGRKNPKHSLLGGPNKASSSYMASRVQGQERELEASGPDSEDSDLEDSKSNLD